MRLAGHKSVVVFCCCFEQIVHTSEKACGQRCSDNVLSILCTKKQCQVHWGLLLVLGTSRCGHGHWGGGGFVQKPSVAPHLSMESGQCLKFLTSIPDRELKLVPMLSVLAINQEPGSLGTRKKHLFTWYKMNRCIIVKTMAYRPL